MKIGGLKKTSNSSDNPFRDTKGKGGMRSKATINRLNMYKNGAPIRDKDGKIVGGNLVMRSKSGEHYHLYLSMPQFLHIYMITMQFLIKLSKLIILFLNNISSIGGKDMGAVARIAPDRRWFGNTRTVSQTELEKFRDEMTTQAADPLSVILRRKKIPMALLKE